jgi:1-deoxy-D-xylulose 5-phosphate reductoisomerase
MNNNSYNTETSRKRQIAILGSTGSIGTQALQVIEEHSDLYEVYALTAGSNVNLLIEQARKFQPDVVVIANEAHYKTLVRYINFEDKGMVLGYGCGAPGMTKRSRYMREAYELGRSL